MIRTSDACGHARVEVSDLGEQIFCLKLHTCLDCGHTWRSAKDPPSRPSGFGVLEAPTVPEPSPSR